MTQQELRARLATTPHWDPNGKYMYQALMAVLDIHKPIDSVNNSEDICSCSLDTSIPYPCRTVRAVETILS